MCFCNSASHEIKCPYIFYNLLYKGVIGYLDDITAYMGDFEKHFSILEEVPPWSIQFPLEYKKIYLLLPWSPATRTSNIPWKITNLHKKRRRLYLHRIKIPKTFKDVRSLLSSFGFYRKYISKTLSMNFSKSHGHSPECDVIRMEVGASEIFESGVGSRIWKRHETCQKTSSIP